MTRLHKFSLKNFCLTYVIIGFCLIITGEASAEGFQQLPTRPNLTKDTIPVRPAKTDSLTTGSLRLPDTIPGTRVDTFSVKMSKDTLDAPINYEATDSAVLLVKDKIFLLYGQTKTTYKDVVLTAPRVEINQQTNIVTAFNERDSLGNVIARAHFTQGAEGFQSDTIRFNFKTQKGLTQNTFTKQDEFFVNASVFKKVNGNTTFAKRVIMTTCEFDEPHFGFVSNKGKFIANKIAVTGPIHPEFEGVPVPIYFPFGIFPLNKGRHSGFLPPHFTVNEDFGIGLEGLGYYHVINDYLDVTLRGNIYSYGGWSANLIPTYRKRYRYSGGLNIGLLRSVFNFKGDPDYSYQKNFSVSWNHTVDQKAKPGTNFSANVNISSSEYNSLIANNPNQNVTNQLYSSISYSKTWVGKPYNLTLSANHNQNNNTGDVSVTLPNAGFSVATIYPFQRKEVIGMPKWYEKLGLGYQGGFRNQANFNTDSLKSFKDILDTSQWGAQHRIPLIIALPSMGNIMVSPSVSYDEVWVPYRKKEVWNDIEKKRDTVSFEKGFFTDRQISFALSFNTAIFGNFVFKGKRQAAIRHVMRPSFSFNYKPNLSKNKYDVIQVDTFGRFQALSQLEPNMIYRGFSYGRYGGISFGLDNNLEMKVRNKKDTGDVTYKKIKLIDGFGFNSGYNFLADSLRLNPFTLYLRSNLFDKVNLTFQGNLDPYKVDSTGNRINRLAWEDGFSFGQLTYGSVALTTRFQSKPRTENASKGQTPLPRPGISDPNLLGDQQRLQDYMRRNPAEFVDFTIPWSLDLSFSLTFSKRFDQTVKDFKTDFTSSMNFNNSFSLTPKWNFTVNGYYDFNAMELSQLSMSISRDMHCWQMAISVAPISQYSYFSITISPKSAVLQDLKVNRTRYFYNY